MLKLIYYDCDKPQENHTANLYGSYNKDKWFDFHVQMSLHNPKISFKNKNWKWIGHIRSKLLTNLISISKKEKKTYGTKVKVNSNKWVKREIGLF